jgi:hypothetical protein
MSRKWLVGSNTAKADGPSFKTKREAVQYGRAKLQGIFFVWKADLLQWERERNGARLRESMRLEGGTQ